MNVLTVPAVAHTFQFLRLAAALYRSESWNENPWFIVHQVPNLLRFDTERGNSAARISYNARQLARVSASKRPVCAERAGMKDWFVPIIVDKAVAATLVTGPFLTARPTGPEILERWHYLTGKRGHLADPAFALYAQEALSVLVLEGDRGPTFERLLAGMTRLMAGDPNPTLLEEVYGLSEALQGARHVDRVWGVVDSMLDERSPYRWHSNDLAWVRQRLGLTGAPDQVVIGLLSSSSEATDPIDDLVARDALQRRAVELASKLGRTLSGRVGERGIVFVSQETGSKENRKQRAFELAERMARLARQDFGFSLHFGVGFGSDRSPLAETYEAALGAAESALHQGRRILVADDGNFAPHATLRNLRRELGTIAVDRPDLLPIRFEGYLKAVAAHSGRRLEPARAHLDVGFEHVAESLLRARSLESKTLTMVQRTLDRVAASAPNLEELFTACRRAIADVAEAVARPGSGRKDHSLRRAIEYIDRHYTEPISLSDAARAAGFNTTYFSELFKKRENVTFAKYVSRLRLERAQRLLSTTALTVTRVAELSGHRSLSYFCRSFERNQGQSPLEYRKREKSAMLLGKNVANNRRKISKKQRKVQIRKPRTR